MMHELRALVIIPAFNEEANILDTVLLWRKLDTIM